MAQGRAVWSNSSMAFGMRVGGLVCLLALGAFAACSADQSGQGTPGGNGASSGSGGSAGAAASGGSAGSGNGGSGNFSGTGGLIDAGQGGSGGFDPDADSCAGEVSQGERKPLDMYVMFDMSGSMQSEAAPGVTKWDAVRPALQGFLNSPASAGIGVGIQYFPLLAAGSAWSCTSNSQCGGGGMCALKLCANLVPNRLEFCQNNSDCGFGGNCQRFGECANDTGYICTPLGGTCSGGLGACNAPASSFCTNADSCLVGDYQKPDVNIGVLPGNAAALIASLNAQTPRGATPTGPALQGAIQQAQSYANSNPGHQVVTVLVTDGTPTSCNPTAIGPIANLASAALNANPSVQTFVIGVFESGDTTGPDNANQIANAGGTGAAFVVNAASTDLGAQFTQALEDIRGSALSCEYSIPAPSSGELDYGKVNVEFKDGAATVTVPYVGDASSCDPSIGGWYYDADPAGGGTPSTIVVCPATCDQFTASSSGATVDVRLGCKREDIPK